MHQKVRFRFNDDCHTFKGSTNGATRGGWVKPKDRGSLGGFVKEDHTTRMIAMITEPEGRTLRGEGYNNADSSISSALLAITRRSALRNNHLLVE